MDDNEARIQREQVEQVFGLTGGELADEPWTYWTQQESDVDGKPLYGPESDHKELWPGHRVESHREGFMEWHGRYWYDGPPEYVEREMQSKYGLHSSLRTLVNPGGIMSAPYRELYDGDGVWRLVETFNNSGEAECPFRSYDEPQQRIVGGDGVMRSERCDLCDEEQGDEHGYIYLGVCSYEAVYMLVWGPHVEDEGESVANEWPEGSGG